MPLLKLATTKRLPQILSLVKNNKTVDEKSAVFFAVVIRRILREKRLEKENPKERDKRKRKGVYGDLKRIKREGF